MFEAGDCAGRSTADELRVVGLGIEEDGFAVSPKGLDNALVVFLVKSEATLIPALAVFLAVSLAVDISEPAPALSDPTPALTDPRKSLKLLLVA